MPDPARPAPVPDVSVVGPPRPAPAGPRVVAEYPRTPLPPFGTPECRAEMNRVRREWVNANFPGGVMCVPRPPLDGAPHPTLRRRPRPPHVPPPPPHLDPDLSEADRAAAYKELTGCDPPVWYC